MTKFLTYKKATFRFYPVSAPVRDSARFKLHEVLNNENIQLLYYFFGIHSRSNLHPYPLFFLQQFVRKVVHTHPPSTAAQFLNDLLKSQAQDLVVKTSF